MSKQIILITGKKRSGKDTSAKILEEFIPNSKIISFASPMKEIISKIFNISVEALNYSKDNGKLKAFIKYKKPIFLLIDFRKTLQQFGSEIMKPIFGEDVWVQTALREINNSKEDTIIISDWRFLAEQYKDATTIRINRDGTDSDDSHSSENELNDVVVDYEIENNGTYGQLNKKLYEVVLKIEKGNINDK